MLRDLSADSRDRIALELEGVNEQERPASARFDEDDSGTRSLGPFFHDRLDEDTTGTRVLGPMFRTP
jgi:hypothetical protein